MVSKQAVIDCIKEKVITYESVPAGGYAVDNIPVINPDKLFSAIKEIPIIEQPTGEWLYNYKEDTATCSNCKYEHYLGAYREYSTNFCPNCGAKMKMK